MTLPADPTIYRNTGQVLIELQPIRAILHLTDNLTIHTCSPVPNWWRRFWYWAFLGWKWTRP